MRRLTVVLLAVGGVVVLSLALSGAFRGGAPPSATEPPTLVIALDAGHGGVDPGAVAGDVLEKDVTAAITTRLAALLEDLSRFEIVLTRPADLTISNRDRIAVAEDSGAILYLSVHANASDQASAHGIEVWVDKSRALDDDSYLLAQHVLETLTASTEGRDRGIRSGDLYLRHADMPAVSVEVGFLTHPHERERLLDPVYQDAVARGILAGVVAYLEPSESPVADEGS
ncbi:MAG: N-acetylmuramoyl-L-alanine amidase [Candidatus Bipolaricaulota bacterium]|nr:MAG: N-acetylmuramoyl-L-alanine amidase [Candidatus Bipolaricaulota bacterium]